MMRGLFERVVRWFDKTDDETVRDHLDRLSGSLCNLGIATIGLSYFQPAIKGEGSSSLVWICVGVVLYSSGHAVLEQKRRFRDREEEEQSNVR